MDQIGPVPNTPRFKVDQTGLNLRMESKLRNQDILMNNLLMVFYVTLNGFDHALI